MQGYWQLFYKQKEPLLNLDTRMRQICPICHGKDKFHWYHHSAQVGAGYCSDCGVIPDGFSGIKKMGLEYNDLYSFLGKEWLGYTLNNIETPEELFSVVFQNSESAIDNEMFVDWTEQHQLLEGGAPSALRILNSVPQFKIEKNLNKSVLEQKPCLILPVLKEGEIITLAGMFLDQQHILFPSEKSGVIQLYDPEPDDNKLIIVESIADMLMMQSMTGLAVWCVLNTDMVNCLKQSLEEYPHIKQVYFCLHNCSINEMFNIERKSWIKQLESEGVKVNPLQFTATQPSMSFFDLGKDKVEQLIKTHGLSMVNQPSITSV